MGEWDFRCFLCAASFHRIDEDYHGAVKTDLVPPEAVEWMGRLRLIGMGRYVLFKPMANGGPTITQEYYLSGPGRSAEYGMAEVTPGNDPAFPVYALPTPDGRFAIDVYRRGDDDQTGALPFHPECFLVFVKALANACGDATITRFEDVDLGRLFECLSPMRERWLNCLTLDYGELMEKSKRERDFYIEPGMEPDVMNPVDVPGLREVFERATKPPGFSDISDRPPPQSVAKASNDPFNRLPPELNTEIMLYLPTTSFFTLITESPAAHAATHSNWFWHRRLMVDMPWMWELLDPSYVPENRSVDWKALYQSLYNASFAPSDTDSSLLGLANRSRIWGVCEQVLKLYLGYEEPKQPTEPEEHEVD